MPMIAVVDDALPLELRPTDMPPSVALAGVYQSRSEAFDYGLVVLAMNTPFWLVEHENTHRLYVEESQLPRIARELSAYTEEMRSWRSEPQGLPEHSASFYVPYLGAILLGLIFVLQSRDFHSWDHWVVTNNQLMMEQGEWWRAASALFIHADAMHLLSNIVFGWWYGSLAARGYGAALGWGLTILAAVLANATEAILLYPQVHQSLGYSTAVFASLGLLVAHGLAMHKPNREGSFLRRLGPLLAGLMLFSLVSGIDSAQIDWLSHALGFAWGLLLGWPVIARLARLAACADLAH